MYLKWNKADTKERRIESLHCVLTDCHVHCSRRTVRLQRNRLCHRSSMTMMVNNNDNDDDDADIMLNIIIIILLDSMTTIWIVCASLMCCLLLISLCHSHNLKTLNSDYSRTQSTTYLPTIELPGK